MTRTTTILEWVTTILKMITMICLTTLLPFACRKDPPHANCPKSKRRFNEPISQSGNADYFKTERVL